jgi:hypothetical protein
MLLFFVLASDTLIYYRIRLVTGRKTAGKATGEAALEHS